MKQEDLTNYYTDNEQRCKERTISVYTNVSANDWAKLPALASAFFQEFEASLLLFPIGTTHLEVWFLSNDQSNLYVDLDEAAAFIQGFLHR